MGDSGGDNGRDEDDPKVDVSVENGRDDEVDASAEGKVKNWDPILAEPGESASTPRHVRAY